MQVRICSHQDLVTGGKEGQGVKVSRKSNWVTESEFVGGEGVSV